MKHCKWYQMCPIKRFTDEGKLDPYWVNTYCKGDWRQCKRYEMEERGEYHQDNMLADGGGSWETKVSFRFPSVLFSLPPHAVQH
ncbi:MAG: hypothetical protein K9J27_01520 [Bacteroidales bacterium]|nr:hypothetical protein [Bacteroidales bacterium]MCF8332653.1 hypothetical protein [Bacteroidales bacterium]